MLSSDDIRRYRALAAKHPDNVASKIITHLLDEYKTVTDENGILRLKTADKHGEYDDFTPCPFGKHKGQHLKDVPYDWLQWWFNQSKRDDILFDMDYGPWPKRLMAVKRLRLWDYLKEKQK
jgi:hypothetical protein